MEARTRFDEKLARIMKQAAVVFAEKGYHQASIRDISAATEVSLSGLYYYFESKEELLFLIQRHAFETVLTRLDSELEGAASPEERLRAVVRNHLGFFVHNMPEMKVLSHEAEALTGAFRSEVSALKRRYSEIVTEILSDLSPAGRVPDARVATFTLFGMMNWIYNWYRPDRDVGVERMSEELLHIFLRGYSSPLNGNEHAPHPSGGEERSMW